MNSKLEHHVLGIQHEQQKKGLLGPALRALMESLRKRALRSGTTHTNYPKTVIDVAVGRMIDVARDGARIVIVVDPRTAPQDVPANPAAPWQALRHHHTQTAKYFHAPDGAEGASATHLRSRAPPQTVIREFQKGDDPHQLPENR